jgi:transcriptional regulator with XRE-family HTH domain
MHDDFMAMSYRDVLARNIRAERARAGLSQQDVAARMRMLGFQAWKHQTVGSVERGSRRVTAEEILGLAISLTTSISTLMTPKTTRDALALPSGITLTMNAAGALALGEPSNAIWHGNILALGKAADWIEEDSHPRISYGAPPGDRASMKDEP